MPMSLTFVITGKIPHQKRPRAYNTHVAIKNIPKLRQFIQTCSAKHSAKICETLLIRKQFPLLISRIGHTAEFIHPKDLSISTRTLLRKKHRFSEFHTHKNHQHKIDRREHQKRYAGKYHIYTSFYSSIIHEHPPKSSLQTPPRTTSTSFPSNANPFL